MKKNNQMKITTKIANIFNNRSLRTKLVIMYMVVLLPMFIGSVVLFNAIKDSISENTRQSSLKDADSIEIRLEDMTKTVEGIMNDICTDRRIPSFLNRGDLTNSEIFGFYAGYDLIDNYLSYFPQIKHIRVYLERDDLEYNGQFRPADDNIISQSWYRDSEKADIPVWKVVTDSMDKEKYLACAQRITDESGKRAATAVIEIDPEWIGVNLAMTSFATVLSVDNGIVYYSNENGIKAGDIISLSGEYLKTPGIKEVMDSGVNDISARTVLSTFTGSYSSGVVFQILLINPGSSFEAETNRLASTYFVYIAAILVLCILLIIFFVSTFSRRIKLVSEKMHSVALGNFAIERELGGNDEIAGLEDDLCIMVDSMQLMMNEAYTSKLEAEKLKLTQKDAEFKALASQINPHFLYNTLETIRMKAYCNNDKETADLIKKLGKFMRRCLEVKNDKVTLKSEIEFTTSYLELQSARFGDKITYTIHSSVDDNYMILPLIIQPIVENAFVHGIESSVNDGRIDINVYNGGECVYIDVYDNGTGITPEKMKQINARLSGEITAPDGKNIGLRNVNERIKMSCGSAYGINIQSKEGRGTLVRIMLPKNSGKDVKNNA